MSDTFRVRFDGREWWAREDWPDKGFPAVFLYDSDPRSDGAAPLRYLVPVGVIERITPEPEEPPEGTVLYDDNDSAWMRREWRWAGRDGWRRWDELQERGPLHPYPKAARAEIERLQDEGAERLIEWGQEADNAAELHRRINRVLEYIDDPGNWGASDGRRELIASWLRGE